MIEGILHQSTHRLLPGGLCLLAASSAFVSQPIALAKTPLSSFASRCTALKSLQSPILGTIISAEPGALDFEDRTPFGVQVLRLPQHCEITATFPSRQGRDNQSYAIRYHVRLPTKWNGRFLFQGGGGTNGELGNALGPNGMGNVSGLIRGYAVVSQDSGHDNATNNDPARGGVSVFGTDPQARRDYGHTSLPKVAHAAKELIGQFYGSAPKFSYFFGCSKGGQEGMAFAQRYPDIFDGIVAAAPGFSLPRAALAQTWDTQTFAQLWNPANGKLTAASFSTTFSEDDFAIIRDAVTKSCDALDGLADGMINAFGRCTSARVLPILRAKACNASNASGNACIAPAKIDALQRSLGGPRDASGRALYADWPWDTGIGTFGWSLWKLGSTQMPSLNILTGGASLPSVFMVPPKAVRTAPDDLLAFQLAFRFPEDAKSIYATSPVFEHSAWQDIAMRSPNLDRFRARGGKLIVPHGVSDPVFSINDTLQWQREVNQRYRGRADQVVRVFPVPGMAHCGGGPATDSFDAFDALTNWVENGKAPDLIAAKAGPQSPWPGRSRPLCAYPKIAVYDGRGPIDDMRSFQCKKQPRHLRLR